MNHNISNPSKERSPDRPFSTVRQSFESTQLSLENLIAVLKPEQLSKIVRDMSLADFQKFETELLSKLEESNPKHQQIVKILLDLKVEKLTQNVDFYLFKPAEFKPKSTIVRVKDVRLEEISHHILSILNQELTQHLSRLDEAMQHVVFNQMNQAQLMACQRRIQLVNDPRLADLLEKLDRNVKQRFAKEIDPQSQEIQEQLIKVQDVVRNLVEKLEKRKIPFKARIKKIEKLSVFAKLIDFFVTIFKAMNHFFDRIGEADPKKYMRESILQGRVMRLDKVDHPHWSQEATTVVLGSNLELTNDEVQIFKNLRSQYSDLISEFDTPQSHISHALGMTVSNVVAARTNMEPAYEQGGFPYVTTPFEMNALEELLEPTNRLQIKKKYNLFDSEIEKLEDYLEGLNRGKEINEAFPGIDALFNEKWEKFCNWSRGSVVKP